MLSKTNHKATLFLSILTFLLVGCKTNDPSTEMSIYGNSSITRMPVARYIATHKTLIHKVEGQGVKFVQTGDDLILILQSNMLFAAKTSILNADANQILNNIASLLKDHEKFSIKIAGYNDSMKKQTYNIALSRAQAEVVANYLWKQGVNARLLYAVGYGSLYLNTDHMSQRIEIHLRWVTDFKQG